MAGVVGVVREGCIKRLGRGGRADLAVSNMTSSVNFEEGWRLAAGAGGWGMEGYEYEGFSVEQDIRCALRAESCNL